MSDANERDATLAQRIRDALRGVTPIAFDERAGILGEVDENGVFRVWEQPVFTLTNIALIVAAPSLLRDALARIEADAARIAALEEQVVLLEREIGLMSMDFPPEATDDDE